jgi:hypothetical protein
VNNESGTNGKVEAGSLRLPPQAEPVGRALLVGGAAAGAVGGVEPQIHIYCDETGCSPTRPGVPPPFFDF